MLRTKSSPSINVSALPTSTLERAERNRFRKLRFGTVSLTLAIVAGGALAGALLGLTLPTKELVLTSSEKSNQVPAGVSPSSYFKDGEIGTKGSTHTIEVQQLKGSVARKASDLEFSWQQQQTELSICSDTCSEANNGVCDDGRQKTSTVAPREGYLVLCDLGTDCADCGPHLFNVTGDLSKFKADLPIQRLRKRNIEVRVARTSTNPSFFMPFTDSKLDVDVSASMANGGAVEMGLSQVWYHRLKDHCVRSDGSRALIVDVGGNFGWYSLFGAAMGCRSIAWEPVPHFRDFFLYGIAINGFQSRIQVRSKIVSDQPGMQQLVIPQRGIWGTAGVQGINIDKGIDNEGEYERLDLETERVDEVVHEAAILLKMDIEGYEPHALKSAEGLFQHHSVDNVVMEYSPGPLENSQQWDLMPSVPAMLQFLVQQGFTILHIWDNTTRGHVTPEAWEAPPPAFSQVTPQNLVFDMADAAQSKDRLMGCPKPEELSQRFNAWSGCNFIPEDLHPQSFRGTFGHNTNIFAMRELGGMRIGPPVGVFPLNQDLREWFGGGEVGIGGRPCEHLTPAVQVRHRCPCTDEAICGAEAALVTKLAKAAQMTPLATGRVTAAA